MYRGPTSVPSFGTPMNTPGASVPTLGHGSIPTPHPAPSALTQHGDASEPSSSSALSFLSDNWKLILGASVVAAIAAGAVFWATSSPPPPSAKNPNFEQEKKKGKKKKVSAPQEEESSPAQPAEKKPQEEAKPADAEDPYAGLSVEEKALKIKEKGNKYFAGKKYDKAIELYTEALELVPNSKEAAVFYSNRAACYSNLNMHDLVIADCNSALSIDKMYVKALNRRAAAYEHLKRYHEALVDLTAACILEGFKNDVALKGADRIIKHLGTERASEFFPKRSIRLPANYFLTSYFDSFSNPYETILPHESADKEGDAIYLEAVKKVRSRDFSGVFELVESALEKDTSFKAQAHNLRGTLKYLMGNYDGAIEDLSQALELEPSSNSLIKRASVWFEKKQIEECFGDFNRAASANPDNSDVYYHRGQAHFVTGDLAAALEDYKKAMSINPDVPFVHVQMAVIYFRAQSIQTSIETFKTALEKFPNYGDLYNYYGEVLTELQQFEEALKNFEIAFQKNPQNPLSLINKSFLLHRWKEDAAASEALLKQATEVDPYCELAYAHLGQLYVQQSKLPEAIEAYEKAVECSRTEGEIAQWYSCVEAAVAQSKVLEMYPHIKDLAKGGSA